MTRYYRKMSEGEVDTWDNPEWIELDDYKKIDTAGYNTDSRPSYFLFNAQKFIEFSNNLPLDFEKRDERLAHLKKVANIFIAAEKFRLQKEIEALDSLKKKLEETT